MNLFSFDYHKKSKCVALLLDPDKIKINREWIQTILYSKPDFIFIGGSQPFPYEKLVEMIQTLKKSVEIPLIGFPGNNGQINESLDAILALSVIQSYDSKNVIGHLVECADLLSAYNLKIYYTPYLIFDLYGTTSVSKALNHNFQKLDSLELLAKYLYTVKYLNAELIYLEAGSGAEDMVIADYILATRKILGPNVYILVGGGIDTIEKAYLQWKNGADCIVIGNAVEHNLQFLREVCGERDKINRTY